jgi:peptidoglycan/LPS O-acetylase OafA/YrhL
VWSSVTFVTVAELPAHHASRGNAIREPQPRKTSHFPCFDGLRAIAALSVIGVHTSFVSGFTGRSELGRYSCRLEIGVSVFFVISGFLLYRPFAVAHFEGGARPGTRSFWVRRLRRIVPAYWVAFIVIVYVLHAAPIKSGWGSLAIYLGFAQIYFPAHALKGITQAWSLCTEMSFYLVLPLIAALLGRRRRSPDAQLRAELIGLGTMIGVSLGWRIWVLQMHGKLAATMPNWLPGYADLFALGMLLAVVSSWLSVTDREPRVLWHSATPWVSWGLAAAAFIAVSNIGLPLTPLTPSAVGLSLERQTLYGLFALFLVLPAVFGPQNRSPVRRILQTRPFVFLGVVSYGIYLWHESWIEMFLRWTGDRVFTFPLLDITSMVVVLAAAVASLSYVLVERPIMRGDWKAWRSRRSWKPTWKPTRRPTHPAPAAGVAARP